MDAAGGLLWLGAVVMTLLGWMLTFTLAWIFPYAWRSVGLFTGLLWGLAPQVVPVWRRLVGEPNVFAAFWSWFALPARLLAGALHLPAEGGVFTALGLAVGLALGLLAAWSGNYFRILR